MLPSGAIYPNQPRPMFNVPDGRCVVALFAARTVKSRSSTLGSRSTASELTIRLRTILSSASRNYLTLLTRQYQPSFQKLTNAHFVSHRPVIPSTTQACRRTARRYFSQVIQAPVLRRHGHQLDTLIRRPWRVLASPVRYTRPNLRVRAQSRRRPRNRHLFIGSESSDRHSNRPDSVGIEQSGPNASDPPTQQRDKL
jgi:hypothetical protein